MSAISRKTILIVGAGIFGTSTAYHFSLQNDLDTDLIILDRAPFPAPPASDFRDSPWGASDDISKIVRSDYSDPFYMSLAYEAMDAWSNIPVLQPFYHRTGWVALGEEGSDVAGRVRKNFKNSGRADPTEDKSLEEVKSAWGGALKDTDFKGFRSAYFNAEAGWAEADRAVAALLKDAFKRGVKYVQGEVAELLLDDGERKGVKGVRLADGSVINADTIVLATGAWTNLLISKAEVELGIDEMKSIEQQIKATGVCVAHFALDEKEMEFFGRVPVVTYGANGEMLPPSSSKLMKFNNANSFSNTMIGPKKRFYTAPLLLSQDEIPQKLKTETLNLVSRIMPSIPISRSVSSWRLCWDSLTPTQDQLITKHPDVRLTNLYLAVGGSFHSWKFLPSIGKYVLNVVNGKSNGEEKDGKWAWKEKGWNSGGQKGAHEKVVPQRELKGLLDVNESVEAR